MRGRNGRRLLKKKNLKRNVKMVSGGPAYEEIGC